jgi:hypothetical protein
VSDSIAGALIALAWSVVCVALWGEEQVALVGATPRTRKIALALFCAGAGTAAGLVYLTTPAVDLAIAAPTARGAFAAGLVLMAMSAVGVIAVGKLTIQPFAFKSERSQHDRVGSGNASASAVSAR